MSTHKSTSSSLALLSLTILLAACSRGPLSIATPTDLLPITAADTATITPNAIPAAKPTAPAAPLVVTLPPTQSGQPEMPLHVMAMSFVDPSHGWLLGDRGSYPSYTVALASTVDGGKTWQPLPLPPRLDPRYEYEVASQIRGGIYFLTAKDGWLFYRELYSTHDGGLTWTYEPVNGTIAEMGKAADGTVWALERHSDDWSVKRVAVAPYHQWRELLAHLDMPHDRSSLTFADAKHAWVSGRGTGNKSELEATENGGIAWYRLNSPCAYADAAIVAVGPQTLWNACGGSGAGPWGDKLIAKSNDGGRTWDVKAWTPMGPPHDGATISAYGYYIGFGAVSPSFAYMSLGRSSRGLITRDGGTTWEGLPLGCTGGEFHQVFFTDTQHGWAFYQTCVNRTVDGGKTWECVELPDSRPCPP